MLERVYGNPASTIINDEPCIGVFKEGACQRFRIGAVGRLVVEANVNGTLEATEEAAIGALTTLTQSSEEEIDDAFDTGVLNGTALDENQLAVLEEFYDNILPNVTMEAALESYVRIIQTPPKLTDPSVMKEMCSYDNTIVSIYSDVIDQVFGYSVEQAQNVTSTLADLGPANWTQSTGCDHWVYLVGGDGCFLGPDEDIFEFFTWGAPRYAKLDVLMSGDDGVMCEAIVSDQ